MKLHRALVGAALVVAVLSGSSCSSDGTSTDTTPRVGQPIPALPPSINPIPYKPGDLAALGNAQISISVDGQTADGTGLYTIDVKVISGALDEFTITSDMFRLYTLDGLSYTPVATGGIGQFGNTTLSSGATYEGTMAVLIPTDSPPAMFVANLSTISGEFFPGAWVLDPNFEPVPID